MKKYLIAAYVIMAVIGYGLTNASMQGRFRENNTLTEHGVAVYAGVMWPFFMPLVCYLNGFKYGWKL
jgi:hypothetical protein